MMGLTRFVTWPASFPGGVLNFCFVGKTPFNNESYSVSELTVKGLPIEKKVFNTGLPSLGDISNCHVLYFSDLLEDIEVNYYLNTIKEIPILTVSSRSSFSNYGGMIQFIMINRKMRFKLNLTEVKDSGLKVHPSVIKLALPGKSAY